ncbi:MAG: ClpXP protease specificity-enhancing factor SspB [Rickettsiales bacterium]|nr:ClpXP protease specificity-enhancing factor SspB [Rickettsiales bacterium]
MQDLIGYDEIIEKSMRSVIYETLKKIEKTGLPGGHYFVVTFLTHFPGVILPEHLTEKYPEEITIAIQYQYKNLVVEKDHFKISLSFSGKNEKMTIPYKAVTSFADPSMNFGLKFSVSYDEIENFENGDYSDLNPANNSRGKEKKLETIDLSAKVISLDAFRKNKDKNPS